MPLQPGTTLGPYQIVSQLGSGGMGVVYQATDPRLKRTVAIKLLPPGLTRDETAKQRFLQEAQAASALDHPNICTIHEINETDDGQLYLVMAHYEGETLKDKDRGPLELEERNVIDTDAPGEILRPQGLRHVGPVEARTGGAPSTELRDRHQAPARPPQAARLRRGRHRESETLAPFVARCRRRRP